LSDKFNLDNDSAAAILLLDLLPESCKYIRDEAEGLAESDNVLLRRVFPGFAAASLEADTLSLDSCAIAADLPLNDPYQLLLLRRLGRLSSLSVRLLAVLLIEAAGVRGSGIAVSGFTGVLGRSPLASFPVIRLSLAGAWSFPRDFLRGLIGGSSERGITEEEALRGYQ